MAAAKAMEIDTLHQIDTGLDPVTAEREQWDDGNNTLAVAPRVAVAYERNIETNSRLEEAGIEVIAIAGLRARLGTRRPALHVLPDRPRRGLSSTRRLGIPDPLVRKRRCPTGVDGGDNIGRAIRMYGMARPAHNYRVYQQYACHLMVS